VLVFGDRANKASIKQQRHHNSQPNYQSFAEGSDSDI